jgi:hypothetical protein
VRSALAPRTAAWWSSLLLLAALAPLTQALAVQEGPVRPAALAACHGVLLAVLLLLPWAEVRRFALTALGLVLGLGPSLAWAGFTLGTGHEPAGGSPDFVLAMAAVLALAAFLHGTLASVVAASVDEAWRVWEPGGGPFGPFRSTHVRGLPFRDRAFAVALLLVSLLAAVAVAHVFQPDTDWPWTPSHTHCGHHLSGCLGAFQQGVEPGRMLNHGLLAPPVALAFLGSGRARVLNLSMAVLPGFLLLALLVLGPSMGGREFVLLLPLVPLLALPGGFCRFALPVLARRSRCRRAGPEAPPEPDTGQPHP